MLERRGGVFCAASGAAAAAAVAAKACRLDAAVTATVAAFNPISLPWPPLQRCSERERESGKGETDRRDATPRLNGIEATPLAAEGRGGREGLMHSPLRPPSPLPFLSTCREKFTYTPNRVRRVDTLDFAVWNPFTATNVKK